MGLKLIRVGKYSVGKASVAKMPLIYKCKDWVVDLCLSVWIGSMLLGEYLDWEKTPWYIYIVDFIIVETIFVRFNKKLPSRCWRSVIYYSLYCAAAVVIGYTIVYFTNPDYFNTPHEWVKVLIIISIFLAVAAIGTFMWRRRVIQGKEILLRREMKAKRRRLAY